MLKEKFQGIEKKTPKVVCTKPADSGCSNDAELLQPADSGCSNDAELLLYHDHLNNHFEDQYNNEVEKLKNKQTIA